MQANVIGLRTQEQKIKKTSAPNKIIFPTFESLQCVPFCVSFFCFQFYSSPTYRALQHNLLCKYRECISISFFFLDVNLTATNRWCGVLNHNFNEYIFFNYSVVFFFLLIEGLDGWMAD